MARHQRGRRRRSRHRARHRQSGKCRPDPSGPPDHRDTREHRAAGLPRRSHQRSSRPPGRGLTSAPLYVAVLVLTGAALIVNAATLTLRSGWRSALLAGLAAVIVLSLALPFALSTPWRGTITISGQPIDAVARDLNIGYFHPLPRPTRG